MNNVLQAVQLNTLNTLNTLNKLKKAMLAASLEAKNAVEGLVEGILHPQQNLE